MAKKKTTTYDTKEVTPERRICVPAPMPITCPYCRSQKTRIRNGVHYNISYGVRYEHRVCLKCERSFTAARRMTEEELNEKK